MKTLCLLLPLILAVGGQENAGQAGPPATNGLCLDPKMMSAVCTINTDIGLKMEMAHMKCGAAAQVEERKKGKGNNKGRGKGKGKGKGKKRCDVDLDALSEFFGGVWEQKACILKEVGWVDQEGEIVPDNIMAGIGTLDSRMSEGLSDTKDLCGAQAANVTIETMFDGEDFIEVESQSADAPLTTDEDCKIKDLDQEKVAEIEDSLRKLSYIACVHGNFMTACGNFILEQMDDMVRYMTEGGFTSLPARNVTEA